MDTSQLYRHFNVVPISREIWRGTTFSDKHAGWCFFCPLAWGLCYARTGDSNVWDDPSWLIVLPCVETMMAAGHHRTPIVFQENRTAISPGTRTGMNNKIKRAGAACKQLSAVDYVWCCVVLCVCFFVDAVDAVDVVVGVVDDDVVVVVVVVVVDAAAAAVAVAAVVAVAVAVVCCHC